MCSVVFFFKQKTAYEMRISDWSSDVCSSDLQVPVIAPFAYVLSGTPLGIAQGVVGGYVDSMKKRVANYTGSKISELQNIQIKVAEAAAGEIGRASCRERVCQYV